MSGLVRAPIVDTSYIAFKNFRISVPKPFHCLLSQDRRSRAARPPPPPPDSDQDDLADLCEGKYGAKAAEASSAAKRLLAFFAPEIRESNMSAKDQGFMVDAMVEDGFDTDLM